MSGKQVGWYDGERVHQMNARPVGDVPQHLAHTAGWVAVCVGETTPAASVQVEAVLKAAREWSAERAISDWCEADLMKAIVALDGDWPGCDECDHQCDEPCMPATVEQMIRSVDNEIAQLVHDGKLGAYIGYAPPEGFKPDLSRRKTIPIAPITLTPAMRGDAEAIGACCDPLSLEPADPAL